MEVHNQLGAGFLEAVYREALGNEFRLRDIPFAREVRLPIWYKGEELTCKYCADFICYDDVILETKAIKQLTDVDRAQLINYLKATKIRRGLLANFGSKSLEYERLVN